MAAEIPNATVKRLSYYLRSLRRLKDAGVSVVSSEELVSPLNISSAQFRKDLSYFGAFGRKGVGYRVDALIGEIGKILGTDSAWKVAVVGTGRLGSAFISYPGFSKFNFIIAAAFDNDPSKTEKFRGSVKIENIARMKEVIGRKKIKLALLCVPQHAAQKTAIALVNCGIRAILNFSPVHLLLPEDITVADVDVAGELERLVYTLKTSGR